MKRRILFPCTIVILLTTVGFRIFQLLRQTDPTNGFFYTDMAASAYLCVGLLAVALLFLFFGGLFRAKNDPKEPVLPKGSVVLGISFLLLAAGILYDAVSRFLTLLAASSSATSSVIWADYVVPVLAVAAGAALLSNGFFVLRKNDPVPALTLIPLLWSLCSVVLDYTRFNGVTSVTENVIDVLAGCTFMGFLLFEARFFAKADTNRAVRWCFALGLPAAVLCAACTLPRWAMMLASHTDVLTHSSTPKLAFAMAAVHILCFLFFLAYQKAPAQERPVQDPAPSVPLPTPPAQDPVPAPRSEATVTEQKEPEVSVHPAEPEAASLPAENEATEEPGTQAVAPDEKSDQDVDDFMKRLDEMCNDILSKNDEL